MRFELRSSSRNYREDSSDRRDAIEFPRPIGRTVSYQQPLISNPLHSLPLAIANSASLKALTGRIYHLESNHGYIHESMPAVEYYKYALNRIRDNIHAIDICNNRIHNLLSAIGEGYQLNKQRLSSGHYSIAFELEAYELRTEVSNLVFLSRAVLDILSTLFQTVYGPQVGQFASFNSALKTIHRNGSEFTDPVLRDYLNSNLEWFYLLKDVRDYLAHYGTFKFSLREEGPLFNICIFRDKEVNLVVSHLHRGLHEFLTFINQHWSKYLADTHNQ